MEKLFVALDLLLSRAERTWVAQIPLLTYEYQVRVLKYQTGQRVSESGRRRDVLTTPRFTHVNLLRFIYISISQQSAVRF